MKNLNVILLFAILFSTLLLSCNKDEDSNNSTQETSIINNWGRNVDDIYIVLKFKGGGILGFEGNGIINDDFGTFTLIDNQITINDSVCEIEKSGNYNYEIDNNNLTFILITDSCESRVETLTGGIWIKQ